MDENMIEQNQLQMQQKSTEELISIWKENNRNKWSDEAFEAIYRELTSRGEKPEAHLPSNVHAKKVKKFGAQVGNFNWFDWLNVIVLFMTFIIAVRFSIGNNLRLPLYLIYGVFITMVYFLTLRMLWIKLIPRLYENVIEWHCSECKSLVAKDASRCPKCGATLQ